MLPHLSLSQCVRFLGTPFSLSADVLYERPLNKQDQSPTFCDAQLNFFLFSWHETLRLKPVWTQLDFFIQF